MKRNLARKFCLLVCLALSLTLLSGFSYHDGSAVTSPALGLDGRYDFKAMHVQNMTPSDQGVEFIPEKVILRKGETEISGYFLTEGKAAVQVKDVALSFIIKVDDKEIWADRAEFNNANISIRPGEKTPHNFVVVNPETPVYDGPFTFDCKLKYWTAENAEEK